MALNQERTQFYHDLLRSELQPALGCTEPIAIAYASAAAAKALGCFPERISVACSGNLIKNVKSVIVPNTNGMRGVETATIAGFISAKPESGLQVLQTLTDADREKLAACVAADMCSISLLNTAHCLHAVIEAWNGEHKVLVELLDSHTHLARIELDGQIIANDEGTSVELAESDDADASLREIWEYCMTADYLPVKDVLERQIKYNYAIAQEGLSKPYGVNVGCALMEISKDVFTRCRAVAAAGSDARMGGCVLPVVINSGSGNQGITVSMPVYVYATEIGATEEQLYRALLLSNLISIFAKHDIGKLSAYCGAVTAATGAGAAITWLQGGDYDAICRTITNALANASGMICDGAKASCAAKIATALDAAFLGMKLSLDGRSFGEGEGIIGGTTSETVHNVGEIARDGMRITDQKILNIMTRK